MTLRGILIAWTLWNAGATAVNTAFYVELGRWTNLAAAVFCGLMFVVSCGWLLREVTR